MRKPRNLRAVAKITNFTISERDATGPDSPMGKVVSWEYEGQQIAFAFEHRVAAYHVEYLDEVLIQAWVNEFPRANLFIYRADGRLKAQPAMPKRPHEVGGVYASARGPRLASVRS